MTIAFHQDGGAAVRTVGDYIGNPMYAVLSQHEFVLLALSLLGVSALVVRMLGERRTILKGLRGHYRALSSVDRFLWWLLVVAGTVHIGLVVGHEWTAISAAYAIGGLAQFALARRVLRRQPRRGWGIVIVGGSLLAYVVATVAGEPPDQVGIGTKLVELAALAIIVTPKRPGRVRSMAATTGMLGAAIIVAFGAWIGAFSGGGGHHVGQAAEPGTLIPLGVDRAPTADEIAQADALHGAIVATARKYEDVEAARRDGYAVDGISGTDFHAANAAYQQDGRTFDPERPENILYAVGPNGPVVTGVMFEMEEIGEPGPAPGGPLTVWHAHDHVCFSLTPPALAGLTSPFGVCPLGSITMAMTGEMLHAWTLPGAPERFGHLDDEWLNAYLGGLASDR